MSRRAFLFASANTPWVDELAQNVAELENPTLAVSLWDWGTYLRFKTDWPSPEAPPDLTRAHWLFPPGFMGRAEGLFRGLLRHRWRRAVTRLERAIGGKARPWVVSPYPWLVESFRGIEAPTIYFNLDAYELYRPHRADAIGRQETELVNQSELVLCLARTQVDAFRARFPGRADRVRHFPLAASKAFLNPRPGEGFDAKVVGYVGNLIDRVDWRLVADVARRMPDVTFVFVGYANITSGGGQRPDWESARDEALALANVKQVPTVAQGKVGEFYWSFGLTWIPYAVDHVFNLASCPTKIMDGLASGRPVLSTDVPECRIYPEWISIFHTADEAVAMIRAGLAQAVTAGAKARSAEQVAFVQREHTYLPRARQLLGWLDALEAPQRAS
jgi:glycosyltransferase involved in cell wall biosynthesis